MKKFSLSYILSLFVFSGVVLLVGILGIYFDSFLKTNSFENTKKRMVHIFHRLQADFSDYEKDLLKGVSFIQTDKYLLSSIDLVNNYQDKENYNAILLDEEKKSIAKQLLDRVKLSLNDDIVLYDENEEIIAFVTKEEKTYRLNYFSYSNGQRVLYSKLESEESYYPKKYQESRLMTFKHEPFYDMGKAKDFRAITYHLCKNSIYIKSHQTLFNTNHRIKAHLEMTHEVGETYFSRLSENYDAHLAISTEEAKYDARSLDFFKETDTEKLQIEQNESVYFASARVNTQCGIAYIVASMDKTLLLQSLLKSRYHLLILILIAALVVLVLLHIVVKRRVTRPLQTLMGQIEKIEHRDYSQSEPVQTGDELELISKNINQLAQTIQKREDELQETQKNFEFLSYHDTLTHLPNRRFFMTRLERAIENAKRSGTKLAIMFLDIDQFKHLNDTLGHEVGDRLLQEVAKRLDHVMRTTDTVARIGGDEFNILAESIHSAEEVEVIVEKVLKVFEDPFICDKETLRATASIGVSLYPDDGEDGSALIKYADMAMYQAKEEGRVHYHFFSSALEEHVKQRAFKINALKSAVASLKEFKVFYQPKISLHSNKIVGIEALARWESDAVGTINVEEFIALAEDTNMIIPLGRWIAQKACSDFVVLQQEGFRLEQLSINISNKQLYRGELVDTFKQIIQETGIDPANLELEITESFAASNEAEAIQTLHHFRKMGMGVAIDDFGTGYSSMSYLHRLPVTRLKIDKSFVENIPGSEQSAAIIKAIIALAKTFGLSVTAEGVETGEQLVYLSKEGCDEIQGYYYAKPMDINTLKTYCRQFNT